MSDLKLINKNKCQFYYSNKPLQIDKYALYEKEGRFIGQIKFKNLSEHSRITGVLVSIKAFDSFGRLSSEFKFRIPRNNNKDSNVCFGDSTPIMIHSDDIAEIQPEILEYTTLKTSVLYDDCKKINIDREKISSIFDDTGIELMNQKFHYHLSSNSIIPIKIEDNVYLDIDGEIKTYDDIYPYEDLLSYKNSDDFNVQKDELAHSLEYMTKHLPDTMSDPETRSFYFKKIRSTKKVFYSIIVCAIIIVVSAGTSIYHYHELHKYDGIWEATRYSSEDDYLDIDSRKVTYYIGKLDDRSYAFVYYGKIKDDKIIFTKGKRTYYSYLLDDYNYKKMSHVKISCKFKVSNNTLHMNDEKFKKSKK